VITNEQEFIYPAIVSSGLSDLVDYGFGNEFIVPFPKETIISLKFRGKPRMY